MELDLIKKKRESKIFEAECKTIKTLVPIGKEKHPTSTFSKAIDSSKNIFGVELKKTGENKGDNKFLQSAKQEYKK